VISHVFIGVSDFDRAFEFYSGLMNELGLLLKFCDADTPWAAWHSAESARPLLIIGKPLDNRPAEAGNGHMVALLASTKDMVDRSHATALSAGAQCEGPPGLRPQYHANYYGAYFRDLDGNKLCVCFHGASISQAGDARVGTESSPAAPTLR
jgi:catechol 2,3-dioxygenase-like lactoylglutathione lyase family enzyme